MMVDSCWRDLNRLPKNGDVGTRVLSSNGSRQIDEALVTAHFARWTPLNGILLTSPAWRRYYPPVRHLKLRQRIRRSTARIHTWAGTAWLLLGLISGLSSLTNGEVLSPLSGALLLLGAVLLYERQVLVSQKHALFERALFFAFLRDREDVRLVLWIVLFIAVLAFGGQEVLVARLGEAGFLAAFGLDSTVSWRDGYRLFTGPMIHADFGHFLANLAMALIIMPLAFVLSSAGLTALVFLVANAVGGWLQLQLGSGAYQYYLGASAGVLSLYAFAFAVSLYRPRSLPPGLGVVLFGVALVSILAAEGLINSAATIAHVAGVAVGLLAGCLWARGPL